MLSTRSCRRPMEHNLVTPKGSPNNNNHDPLKFAAEYWFAVKLICFEGQTDITESTNQKKVKGNRLRSKQLRELIRGRRSSSDQHALTRVSLGCTVALHFQTFCEVFVPCAFVASSEFVLLVFMEVFFVFPHVIRLFGRLSPKFIISLFTDP